MKIKIKKLTIVKYVVEIALIIMLSFMYYLNLPIKSPRILYISQGSINKIISQLKAQNSQISELDALLLRLYGSPQSGWIDMKKEHNTKADFLYKLTRAKAALRNITLVPGETTYVFLNQLANSMSLDYEKLVSEFMKQSNFKEGAFVPDTYRIPLGISEHKLISVLLKVSRKSMIKISKKFFGTYNEKKWLHYVTIASIIQKESANTQEMPIVSSVIHNRLKKGMRLQMDGTLNYGKYSHVKVTAKRIRQNSSSYNTYKHAGLPKLPVCNVSFDAIRAAVFPSKTPYLYFMRSKNGTHDFTSSYSKHLLNIKHATK